MTRLISVRDQAAALIVWSVSNGETSARFSTHEAALSFATAIRKTGITCSIHPRLVRARDHI